MQRRRIGRCTGSGRFFARSGNAACYGQKTISKSYGARVLFDRVDFTVNTRERVGLVGRNGHGKTTLFRLIAGRGAGRTPATS